MCGGWWVKRGGSAQDQVYRAGRGRGATRRSPIPSEGTFHRPCRSSLGAVVDVSLARGPSGLPPTSGISQRAWCPTPSGASHRILPHLKVAVRCSARPPPLRQTTPRQVPSPPGDAVCQAPMGRSATISLGPGGGTCVVPAAGPSCRGIGVGWRQLKPALVPHAACTWRRGDAACSSTTSTGIVVRDDPRAEAEGHNFGCLSGLAGISTVSPPTC